MKEFLSKRAQAIPVSATLAMTQKAREMRAKGERVISLSTGEPDFSTLKAICDAGTKAMADGHTKYTPAGGVVPLKEAICNKFKRDNNLNVEPNQVMACSGAKQVIFNAMLATLNEGDEVIIPAPFWVSYPAIVSLCGGVPIIVDCESNSNYKLTPQALAKAITPRTKWLFLNSPSNPTGVIYSRDELDSLAQVLRDNPHVLVLSDDIYEHLVYDNVEFATMAQVAPDLFERTLTVNGVSKSHAMTGWRLGYCCGSATLIGVMSKLQTQSTSSPASISQYAAAYALDMDQSFLADWREIYDKRRSFIMDKLANIKGVEFIKPQGAFYIFVNIQSFINGDWGTQKAIKDDLDFALKFLEEQKVATVAGSAFGTPGWIRISYALDEDDLSLAMERMEQFLKV